jgi:DNA-binding transcriptional regulator YiaG
MPNLAAILKSEIARLARKESRSQSAVLRKATSQYRRDIAALKRQLKTAIRKLAILESLARKQQGAQVEQVETEGRRYSARSVKAHRRNLGLSAADYGKLIKVTGKTVYTWELGTARPRDGAFRRWIAIRSLGKRQALAMLGSRKVAKDKKGRRAALERSKH